MKRCCHCNSTIIFGGKLQDNLWFCNARCAEDGYPHVVAITVPDELALSFASKIHSGSCPVCGRNGPIDIHLSHRIWSLFVGPFIKSPELVSCKHCGIISQVKGIISSFFLGWWSPKGFFMTPIIIISNVICMVKAPKPERPSDRLMYKTKLDIAKTFIAKQRGRNQCPRCGSVYELADYQPDAEHIYCSLCKAELPRS